MNRQLAPCPSIAPPLEATACAGGARGSAERGGAVEESASRQAWDEEEAQGEGEPHGEVLGRGDKRDKRVVSTVGSSRGAVRGLGVSLCEGA